MSQFIWPLQTVFTTMFHLKGEKLGSEPKFEELGTEISAGSCLRQHALSLWKPQVLPTRVPCVCHEGIR